MYLSLTEKLPDTELFGYFCYGTNLKILEWYLSAQVLSWLEFHPQLGPQVKSGLGQINVTVLRFNDVYILNEKYIGM